MSGRVWLWVLGIALSYGVAAQVFADKWNFRYNLGGYYNRLARSVLEGKLHLDVEPRPELLAAENPWDPNLPDEWRLHDAVLYGGRYYLYHGIAPVLLVLAPFRAVAGWDLPEGVALWLFLAFGFVMQVGTLAKWRTVSGWDALALGLGGGTLFLLHRVWVYEVAIGCGYACIALALWAGVREKWVLAGLGIGLALLARPHLGLALLPLLIMAGKCGMWRLLTPVVLCSAILGWYNWARFGVPWEFGLRYLMSGAGQQELSLRWSHLWSGLGWFLFAPPDWPSLRMRLTEGLALREYVLGVLWLCPAVIGWWRWKSPVAFVGLAVLFFVSATGWITQRYVADFLPWMLLAALGGKQPELWRRIAISGAVAMNLWLWWLGPNNGIS